MGIILIIDDDAEVRETLLSLTRRLRLEGEAVGTLREGIARLRLGGVDVAFLDVSLPDGNGLSALSEIKALADSPEVIILTGRGDPDGAELAIQGGVWDYLLKPSPLKDTMLTLERALKYRTGKLGSCAPVALVLEDVVGKSRPMRACFDAVAGAAGSGASVLVTGETGTGKELFARTIHTNSARRAKPFVVVDCAALTETLVESTLFGHKKGAFTGADSDRVGLVKMADGGTLFLDEVGEMPLNLQKAFLRVLQERRFRPVGESREVESDFRLIAATNRTLESMVERGAFRSDLLYRLKTISLSLPPLRERPEDIKPLCVFRVGQLCEQYGLPLKGFDPDVFQVLEGYAWPGNVRELFNALERAFVAAGPERTLYAMHLPQDVRIKVAKAQLGRSQDLSGLPRDIFRPGQQVFAPAQPAAHHLQHPARMAPQAPPQTPPQAPPQNPPQNPPQDTVTARIDPLAASPAPVSSTAAPAAAPGAPGPVDSGPAGSGPVGSAEPSPAMPESLFEQSLKDCKEALERSYMECLTRRCGGDVQRALEASGLSRSHLYALLKKWGLSIDGPAVGS